MSSGEVKKFEVIVTKECTGSLRDLKQERLTNEPLLSIIQQMLEMLKQLTISGKCHNDIKPANILYNKVLTASGSDVQLKLGDFGLCDQLGGTPGWSPADFTNKREPGVSDLYSVGLVTLFLLSEDVELFYAIRDNSIPTSSDKTEQSVLEFRSLPEIKLIRQMIHPMMECRVQLDDCVNQWNNIQVEPITRQRLIQCGVSPGYLTLCNGTVKQKNE